MKGETENEIAAQGQELQSKYHWTEQLQTETHSKCRISKQFDDTVKYIQVVSVEIWPTLFI